jgi:hypothetical protein
MAIGLPGSVADEILECFGDLKKTLGDDSQQLQVFMDASCDEFGQKTRLQSYIENAYFDLQDEIVGHESSAHCLLKSLTIMDKHGKARMDVWKEVVGIMKRIYCMECGQARRGVSPEDFCMALVDVGDLRGVNGDFRCCPDCLRYGCGGGSGETCWLFMDMADYAEILDVEGSEEEEVFKPWRDVCAARNSRRRKLRAATILAKDLQLASLSARKGHGSALPGDEERTWTICCKRRWEPAAGCCKRHRRVTSMGR